MRRVWMAAAAVLCIVAATGCEPAPTATITAKAPSKGYCGTTVTVTGTVTPASATPRVVLQRTVKGKWVDWMWILGDTGEQPHRMYGTVTNGKYEIPFYMPISKNVLHLRVRSNGGSVVSNGVYITPTQVDTYQCG